jgi:DNA-binding transcriptional ArsR family regulator
MNQHTHKCLEVLGNELKLEIITLLMEQPRTVQETCKILGKEQSLISHALSQLRECSFVDYKKEGKTSLYYIKSEIFTKNTNKPLLELFEEHAKKYCKGKH